ncbi:hypothetical protein glysoja_023453 [Glycine soja]|nr:hypothetical protein glysoja_023453 [Glycine soja]
MKPNWELKNCCNHDQVVFLVTVAVCTVVILAVSKHKIGYEHGLLICRFIAVAMPESERYGEQFYSDPLSLLLYFFMRQAMQLLVEGIQVHADEGGTTQTRGGIYWLILPAGYLGSSFWGMVLILASTNLLTARIAAGCFIAALLIVLFIAKNVVDSSGTLHWIYQFSWCNMDSARDNQSSNTTVHYLVHRCNE